MLEATGGMPYGDRALERAGASRARLHDVTYAYDVSREDARDQGEPAVSG